MCVCPACVSCVCVSAHRSLALLPLFNASSGYLSHKVSSTVLASVSVGVPMVVPPTFLAVYGEVFKQKHVITLVRGVSGGV